MFTISYNLSCLLLCVDYVFALCCMVFCHLLSLCIQAPEDFGLTLTYAAPEDVRRLGREECCCNDKGPQRRDDKDTMRMRLCEDGARQGWSMRGCRRERGGTSTHTSNLGPNGFQLVLSLVHLSKAFIWILIPYAWISRLISTCI